MTIWSVKEPWNKKEVNLLQKKIKVKVYSAKICKINVYERSICDEKTKWLKQMCPLTFNAKLCLNLSIIAKFIHIGKDHQKCNQYTLRKRLHLSCPQKSQNNRK